jgi:beta-aspartyl-peptidase (threonine type)
VSLVLFLWPAFYTVDVTNNVALIVHGGAWEIPSELMDACRSGVQRALDRGWEVLKNGGAALDACEQAIIELEDEPIFDAGLGSHPNRDGVVQLDAILMNGATLKSGGVVAVERIRNPIRLSRLILEKSDHMLLASYGAERFAIEHGMGLCDPRELITDREARLWSSLSGKVANLGTVGAVALDLHGNLAAGTSTGGTLYKYPGRVGDSALVGCGCYADNGSSGVSTTGHGESIMKVVLAKTASDFVAAGKSPQAAAEDAIALLRKRTTGQGGLIILDRQGRVGVSFSTPHMAYAFRSTEASELFDSGS